MLLMLFLLLLLLLLWWLLLLFRLKVVFLQFLSLMLLLHVDVFILLLLLISRSGKLDCACMYDWSGGGPGILASITVT